MSSAARYQLAVHTGVLHDEEQSVANKARNLMYMRSVGVTGGSNAIPHISSGQ